MFVDVGLASAGECGVAGQAHAADALWREQCVVQVVQVLLILGTERLEKRVLDGVRAVGGVGVSGLADKDGPADVVVAHVVVEVPRQQRPAAICPAPNVEVVDRIIPRAHPVAHRDVAHERLHVPVCLEPLFESGAVAPVLGEAIDHFLQLGVPLPVLVLGGVNPLVPLQRRPAVVGAQLAAVAPAVRAEVLQDTTRLEDVAVGLDLGAGVPTGLVLMVSFEQTVVVILHHQAPHLALVDGDIDPLGVRGRQAKLAVQRMPGHSHVVLVHEQQVALAVELVVAGQAHLP